jgi:hypothetical protein
MDQRRTIKSLLRLENTPPNQLAQTSTADPKSDPERFSTELLRVAGSAIRSIGGDLNSNDRP